MQISAKDLGWLKTPDFCPRCFWIERHDRRLPFQTPFAGIFSSIDAYTKGTVRAYFERNGALPGSLSAIGKVSRLVSVKPSEFRTVIDGATLTGIPDEIFQRPDGTYGIIDYKTARYTGTQDALMPVYEVQLNGYAAIAEATGMDPVRDLYLAYFEPPESDSIGRIAAKHTTRDGFEMPFRATVHKVKKEPREIRRLLEAASSVYAMKTLPKGADGCENCARLDGLVGIAEGDPPE